ncbi:MAG: hypothetical protein ACYC8T_07870 [Myxococcaceae bacterium]
MSHELTLRGRCTGRAEARWCSAVVAMAVVTLGGAARAQRPAGIEPGSTELAVGGLLAGGVLAVSTPELSNDPRGPLLATGLVLRVDRVLARGSPEAFTLGLSTGVAVLLGGPPQGASVTEWRPLTFHIRPRFNRLFFEFQPGLSIFSTMVDYPRPVVAGSSGDRSTAVAKYTTALSYAQFRFGMGGGWRWDNLEIYSGVTVALLGGGIGSATFGTTLSYVFNAPWEPRAVPAPETEQPAVGGDAPVSQPLAEAPQAAAAVGIGGEYWNETDTPGRPQRLSLCPDGRYFEGASRVGRWLGPAESDEGAIEILPDGRPPFSLTFRILREPRFCSPEGCAAELDGLPYMRATLGNCSAP